jgi:hypothetical protein
MHGRHATGGDPIVDDVPADQAASSLSGGCRLLAHRALGKSYHTAHGIEATAAVP